MYHLYPSLPLIQTDPTQMRQVLLKLMINAAEATEGLPGTITITAHARRWTQAELATALVARDARKRYTSRWR